MNAKIMPLPGANPAGRKKRPPPLKPAMSKKAAHEISLQAMLVYTETNGDLRVAIPKLTELRKGKDKPPGDGNMSAPEFALRIWHVLNELNTEQLRKFNRDLPAIIRRVSFKRIKGGRVMAI